MNLAAFQSPLHRLRLARSSPYGAALLAVQVAWLLGLALTAACSAVVWPSWFWVTIWLAVGSGLVATLSMLPGTLATLRVEEVVGHSHAVAHRIATGMSSAMLFRLIGTVALFALSGYHMPDARHETAGLILGWYLYLTAVEVCVIARRLPRLDSRTEQSPASSWKSIKSPRQSFSSDPSTTAKP